MKISRNLFLLLSSSMILFAGCRSAYNGLQPAQGSIHDLMQFKPAFTSSLYKTSVDVVGHHLGGLLLIKKMQDSSTRMVFSNEMGVKFFDFAFEKNGDFKVHHIMQQMNKKPVITTLRKDLQLILMDNIDPNTVLIKKDKDYLYYQVPVKGGANYYIINTLNKNLVKVERASKRKPVAEMVMLNYINGIPDTIGISHKGFEFNIALKRIER